MKEFKTLDENLNVLLLKADEKPALTLGEILSVMSTQSRVLAILILSIPFCLPIQIPGLAIPFGIVIAFLGLRLSWNGAFLLPKSVLKKKISSDSIRKMVKNTLSLVNKLRRFIHPRMQWLCKKKFRVLNGILIFFLGLFLALPLPIPLTNQAAGWPIFIMCVGLLYRDGVFILISYIAFLLSLAFFLFLLFEAWHLIKM